MFFSIFFREKKKDFPSCKTQHYLLLREVNLEEIVGSELRSCDLLGLS